MAHNCESCPFRGRYDKKPQSILGRVWRWHINFCPGWKSYMKSLPEEDKGKLIKRYDLKKEKFM
jgi:hypothetical protein